MTILKQESKSAKSNSFRVGQIRPMFLGLE